MKAKIKRINALLEREYGIPKRKPKADLLEVLIQTILSQNTNDQNRDRAYRRLKSQFPRWEEMLNGDRRAIVEALRPGGLARQKAKRIVDILRWLKKRQGKVSLTFMRRMDSEEVKETLGGLRGIGPKTVHCLLLFGLGREAFPVDTHILRAGKRLGVIPEKMDAEKAHSWMVPFVPKGKALSLHLNLIRHGRLVCKAQKPQCAECVLKNECFYIKVAGRPSVPAHRSACLRRSGFAQAGVSARRRGRLMWSTGMQGARCGAPLHFSFDNLSKMPEGRVQDASF